MATEIVKGVPLTEYEAMKKDFEAAGYFQALPSGKLFDPQYNRLLSKGDAADQLSTRWRFRTGGDVFTRDTMFLPIWLKDPSRKQAAWVETKEAKKTVAFD